MSFASRGRGALRSSEESDEYDDIDSLRLSKRPRMDPQAYIDKVVGNVAETSDGDVEETTPPMRHLHDGKRSTASNVVKIEWSDAEDNLDDAYEKFKNRDAMKRKHKSAVKKQQKARVKDAVVGLKRAKTNGEKPPERVWGEDSEYELMEDSLPDYLKKRRKMFDENIIKLQQGGLRLPPSYDDVEFSDDERLYDLEERPVFPSTVRLSRPYDDIPLPASLGFIPASIAQYLRDYQVDGVKFMHELFIYQKGGILGDDMGLGKTVQVAAFLTAAFGKTGDSRDFKRMRKMRRCSSRPWYPRALVICPNALTLNWADELGRWGYWKVGTYHGVGKESVLAAAASGYLEVMITTYGTYKNSQEQINLIEWDCVIADECHIIKDRKSGTTKAMNDVNALCRIGLTGTAIQNSYIELWTLLNWTNPGRFGPVATWKTSICDPLQVGQSHDATVYQLSRARKTAKKLVENLLPQFFLRRMKSLIAHQLPKKTDRVVFCPLTDIQRDAYERFLDSDIVQIIKTASDPCDCGKPGKRGWCCYKYLNGTKWRALTFPVIALLTKLSNHLALLIPSGNDDHDKQGRDLEFMKVMVPDRWRELYEGRDSLITLSNPEFCGKWSILKRLLRFWSGNGDKVLVFSHSVRLLHMLRHLFTHTSYNCSYLDGSMSGADRQAEVDAFNSDPNQFVFLISTKAGGVGLNIVSANKVVIFDPNWNPSYDLQAQDRAYRIGQLRDVEVFRLISSGTVEEIVYARQIYKQQQANIGYTASMERRYFKGVQNHSTQKGEIFGLQNILTYHGDDVVLRDIVNKTNVAEAKAGVSMIGVDMDDATNDEDNPLRTDNEDENAAMSQLVELLTANPEGRDAVIDSKKRDKANFDAVAAILASAGVSYTHDNAEVVGSSKIEAQLSRRAEEQGNDANVGEARLFASSQLALPGDPDPIVKYEYHPPEDVKLRQFCTAARTFGFESVTDFALVVEGWTQEQRRNCLDAFYRRRKDVLGARDEDEDEVLGNVHAADSGEDRNSYLAVELEGANTRLQEAAAVVHGEREGHVEARGGDDVDVIDVDDLEDYDLDA